MQPLALIVDDEPGILTTLAGVLADQGYRTAATRSGQEALEIYRRDQPDLVFLDVWLPDRDGLETLAAVGSWASSAPSVSRRSARCSPRTPPRRWS